MVQVGRSCIKGWPARFGVFRLASPVLTRILAHRGDARRARENTLDAFAAALDAGADGVELDVRRCRSGALVVHHDRTLADGRALASVAPDDLPDWVPTLEDALHVLGAHFVNVEVKNEHDAPDYDPTGDLARAVAEAVATHCALDRVVVSSFDLATLEAIRRADPGVPTGLLVGLTADTPAAIGVARRHGLAAVHPFVLNVADDDVARAHAAGLELAVWTVNGQADLAHMCALGADSVITDDVALAVQVRAGRGRGLAESVPPPLE